MNYDLVRKIQDLETQKRKTNHILHFVLTLIVWPWLIVWIVAVFRNLIHNNHIDTRIDHMVVHQEMLDMYNKADKPIHEKVLD